MVNLKIQPFLDQLKDVSITSVADNELLAYDNSSSTWINQTPTEAGLDSVYLKLDGSNANTDINIGVYDFITAGSGRFDGGIAIGREPQADHLDIQTNDTADPSLHFITTNTAHEIKFFLDENAADDLLDICGETAGVDTQLRISAQDGQASELRFYSGNTNFGFIRYTAGDVLRVQNNKQDENIVFGIDDGGVDKTITWNASLDRLEHSAGKFNFSDDYLITTGRLGIGANASSPSCALDIDTGEVNIIGTAGTMGNDAPDVITITGGQGGTGSTGSAESYGSELIEGGEFPPGEQWTYGGLWDRVSTKGYYENILQGDDTSDLTQTITGLENGINCVLKFDYTFTTEFQADGTLEVYLGGDLVKTINSGSGSVDEVVVSGSTNDDIVFRAITDDPEPDGVVVITVDNVSLKKITAAGTGGTGKIGADLIYLSGQGGAGGAGGAGVYLANGSVGATGVYGNVYLVENGGNVLISADNGKLQIGATATDLQIYSDGINGIIDVATGLRLGNSITNYCQISSTGAITLVGSATINNVTLKEVGTNNYIFGDSTTLDDVEATGTDNIAIGAGAGANITTSDRNIAIGTNTLGTITTASGRNIAIGYDALQLCTGSHNVGLGNQVLLSCTTGSYNFALGSLALRTITTGNSNVAIGFEALNDANGADSSNVAIGTTALRGCVGSRSVGIGYQAGFTNTNGDCLCIGYLAGKYETAQYKLFIDNRDRTDEATGRTNSMFYGVFNDTVANQLLYINAQLYATENLTVTKRISSGTSTITESTVDMDVSDINILFVNPGAATNITGFTNGVAGQVLYVSAVANGQDITMVHNVGDNQRVFLHTGGSETLSHEYGGWTLCCDGSNWYDTEHSKHV